MPTTSHQLIVLFLYEALRSYLQARPVGLVLVAPLRVRLRANTYREPDVVFMAAEHRDRAGESFWDGADLVMEVVSEDGRARDFERKRVDYAAAGIPEYWIVDPREGLILVLALEPGASAYDEHGNFPRGQRATSRLLPGFGVDVTEALATSH